MNIINISSPSNPAIKNLIRLRKTAERCRQELILIDGFREIEMAGKFGVKIKELFYCPELARGRAGIPELGQSRTFVVTKEVFRKACYKENPDGFLATARPEKRGLKDASLPPKPLVIVLETIEKPGNLGAIIRTAYAANVDLIVVNDNQTDIYNPNVIRASEGLIFALPIVLAGREETASWLAKKKITSLAAATSAKQSHFQANLKRGVAIVLGSEADGLSQEWLRTANGQIRIPMRAGVDSLNVSVSAALIIYEALRQRTQFDKD